MKKLLFLGIILLGFTCFNNSFSQEIELSETPEFTGVRPVKVEVLPKYVPLYIISVKELPSYFVSGEIPASFPKYEGNLAKEENEIIALKWCDISTNRELLTEDAKKFVDEKTNEFREKYK